MNIVLLYEPTEQQCIQIYMHATSVSQGQRVILHSRFRIKHFICSQCDRYYIFAVLVKIKQQINSNTHMPMRILL